MTNAIKKIFLFTAFFISIALLTGCNMNKDNSSTTLREQMNKQQPVNTTENYKVDKSDIITGNELIKDVAKSAISEKEKAGLLQMREEEKLARDVYLTLGKKWNMNIFSNIAKSEQTHTNAVKILLDRYSIKDPVADDTVGKFTSPTMQKLYTDLVAQGNSSLLSALTVGAIIEDLDIKDLDDFLKETDNEDIKITYNNLNKGSRNHLRAYIKNIKRNNGTYTPKYISQEQFDKIILSAQEKGRVK